MVADLKNSELGRHFRRDAALYCALYVISLALAVFYVHRLHHDFPTDFWNMVSRIKTGEIFSEPPEDKCPPNNIACEVRKVGDKLHAPQPPLEGFVFKTGTVVCISVLWFVAFTMRGYARILVSGGFSGRFYVSEPFQAIACFSDRSKWWFFVYTSIPALLFAYAMERVYEPAVFVMALVAIYVAAEHYVGLEEVANTLDLKAEQIRASVERAETTLESSSKVIDVGVKEVSASTKSLENASGVPAWKVLMYAHYRAARSRVDGVVRFYDIDSSWWESPYTTCWDDYLKSHQYDTLVDTLKSCEAKVQFVSDFPFPTNVEPGGSGRYFRKLLGLAWTLVVFDHIREYRNQPEQSSRYIHQSGEVPYLRVRVSAAPAWIHVADGHTYQVIERDSFSLSKAVHLNRDIPEGSQEAIKLSDWARRNVRQFAFRGAPAEEYLLSVIRWALVSATSVHLAKGGGNVIEPQEWHAALRELGMNDYLGSKNADFASLLDPYAVDADGSRSSKDIESAMYHCQAAFEEFARRYAPPGRRFTDLSRELL